MKMFVGLAKIQGLYIIGQLDESPVKLESVKEIAANNVVRIAEMADQTGKVRFSLMPDPFFTSDKTCLLNRDDYLLFRYIEEHEEGLVKDYQNLLTQLRMKRSGLVMSAQPDQAKRILQESGI